MRALIFGLVLLFVPAATAAERSPLADAYYACLVGHGAVEVLYGADPELAVEVADKSCDAEAAALGDRSTGDMGSDVEATYEAATGALERLVSDTPTTHL
jgi:hypothetical protein